MQGTDTIMFLLVAGFGLAYYYTGSLFFGIPALFLIVGWCSMGWEQFKESFTKQLADEIEKRLKNNP